MSTEAIIKDPGHCQNLVPMAVNRLEKELSSGSEAVQNEQKWLWERNLELNLSC